jgi:site-specific DNA recombinase
MESSTLRAVGYRRVSMRDQVDGFSLDAQENNIRKFATSKGWELGEIYIDAGISAKKDSHRPSLDRLMKDAEADKFDVVIVDKIDRFYRHLTGLLTALDKLHSFDVSFASVQEQMDFTTPWGKLTLTMLGMLAEIYIDNLRQETRKGKVQRARDGYSNGNLPFGYCKGICSTCKDPNGSDYCPNFGNPDIGDGNIAVPHPIDSQAVKLIFARYATGDYSTAIIAQELNSIELRKEDGTLFHYRTKGVPGKFEPGPISKDAIRDMLQRVFYAGKIPYYGRDDKGLRRDRSNALETYPGKHTALVDESVFTQVQELKKVFVTNPRSNSSGTIARVSPLGGLIRCGYCGAPMRGVSGGMKTRYYRDASRIEKTCDCPQNIINAENIENQVKDLLIEVFDNPELLEILELAANQKQTTEQRFERARDLYLVGELPREAYDIEKQNYEQANQNEYLQISNNTDIISGILDANLGLQNWVNLSLFERKAVFLQILETVYVRDKACAAIQPKVAFYSLFERGFVENKSASNSVLDPRRGRQW